MPSTERLIEVANYVPWETFEKINDGEALLYLPEEDACFSFYLRVGLHMNRPVQAIIAEGNFIRFRSGKKWENLPLSQIDPKQPMSSAYFERSTQYASVGTMAAWPQTHPGGHPMSQMGQQLGTWTQKLVWDPANSLQLDLQMQQMQAQLQMQRHQLQMQQYQALANQRIIPTTIITSNTSQSTTNTTSTLLQNIHNAFPWAKSTP